jgi:hypothetical protein
VSANSLFSSGVSKEMPRICVFSRSKSEVRSRNPCPSTVQPGVEALTNHHSATHLPR